MIRTRFAPSPTGDLHIGGAWTALASHLVAKRNMGQSILRVEDIDTPRILEGSRERIEDDLTWLGLTFDEGADDRGPYAPYAQSRRTDRYAAALAQLQSQGLLYPCDCSRAEIARIASAPHAGEETIYPGTCRDADPNRPFKRPPSIRLRVPKDATVQFIDRIQGRYEQNVYASVGDFVLQRADGIFSYQLAVAIDDSHMAISDVVRGADLLPSTPRQLLLLDLLHLPKPERYWHVPLVVSRGGERIAKRVREATIRSLRESGISPEAILGELAHGLGLAPDPSPVSVNALEQTSSALLFSKNAWALPPNW